MLTVLLDDNRTGAGALLFEQPAETVRADEPEDVAAALERLDAAGQRGLYAAGFMSFELGYLMEPKLANLLPAGRDVPLLLFGLYGEPRRLAPRAAGQWLAARAGSEVANAAGAEPGWNAAAYRKKFNAAQAYIAAGDIYQLNLTFKARFHLEGSPAALYRELRQKQHVAYGALIETEAFSLLSLSPELFISRKGGRIVTRPMKGTARRGLTAAEDRDLAQALSTDVKSRAENLMIVDLMRNDIARIAETGSVHVPDLYTVETYDTVLQMTSGVEAQLRRKTAFSDVLHALYPPGSVTGAPKMRAIEIIRELEDEPRGVYTGAIGVIEPGGGFTFNVAIRTLRIAPDGSGEIGIGSGVVQDSRAQAEYEECLLKMRFLTEPMIVFDLIETMRWDERDGYYLFERHMQRLADSAQRFGFVFERAAICEALENYARKLQGPCHKVRMTLNAAGETQITSQPLEMPQPGSRLRFALAETRLDPANILLYHKTTRRDFYDGERIRLSAKTGCDEALFCNTRGELTEGSFTNVFLRFSEDLLTPALTSGLLAGVLRQELLETGKVREAVLTLDDLRKADAVFFGNSVRGLMRGQAVEAQTAIASAGEAGKAFGS